MKGGKTLLCGLDSTWALYASVNIGRLLLIDMKSHVLYL